MLLNKDNWGLLQENQLIRGVEIAYSEPKVKTSRYPLLYCRIWWSNYKESKLASIFSHTEDNTGDSTTFERRTWNPFGKNSIKASLQNSKEGWNFWLIKLETWSEYLKTAKLINNIIKFKGRLKREWRGACGFH